MASTAELFQTSFLTTFRSLVEEAAAVDRAVAHAYGTPPHTRVESELREIVMAMLGHMLLADHALHVREQAFLQALTSADLTSEEVVKFVLAQQARRSNLLREVPAFLDVVIAVDLEEGQSHAVRIVSRLEQLAQLIAASDGAISPPEAEAISEYGALLKTHLQNRGIPMSDPADR